MARYPRRPGAPLPLVDADTPRLEGRVDQGELVIYALKPTVTTLGRHPNCDVCVKDREVSKQHCTITVKKGGLHLVDLDSSNGTFVNGLKVTSLMLREADELAVGNSRFTVRLGRMRKQTFGGHPDEEYDDKVRAALDDHVFIYPIERVQQLLEKGERKARAAEDPARGPPTELNSAVGVGEISLLRTNLEKLRTASDFHQGLALEPNADGVPVMLVRVARQLTDADNVVLFTIDSRDRLVRRASSRREEHQEEPKVSDQVLQRVRNERATVLSGNLKNDARFAPRESVVAFGIRSVLAVPLLVRGQVRGILHCDTRQRPDAFTDTDARVLAGLAAHAALAMQRLD
jgi:adenylate cyclase